MCPTVELPANWHLFVGSASLLNPFFILPMTYKALWLKETDGVSQITLALLMYLQFVFGIHGYLTGDPFIFLTNIGAGVSTVITSLAVINARRQRHA